MVATFVWHLWPGRHWPASAQEERAFVDDLAALAGEPARAAARYDITAVLNALRCGVTVPELLTYAPGSDPACLLAAYRDLEGRRVASVNAWYALREDPSYSALTEHGPAAGLLLPAPVKRIVSISGIVSAPTLARVIAQEDADVSRALRSAAQVEADLARRTPPDECGVALGAILHNPIQPGLWGHPYYLPPRVGTLSPLRVADLLGERPR